MNWLFSLPVTFLVLMVLIYSVSKKNTTLRKLRSVLPYLFILLLLSLSMSVLNLDLVTGIFHSDDLDNILQLGIFFFALIFSVKFINFFLFDFLFSHKQEIRYPRLIRDITVIILYAIGLLLIAKHGLGIRVTEVLASAAVLTVVAGFALQDILGDLFSGIALNLEESLNIGDWVTIADHEGRIEQFRWRSIKLRTIDNVLVVIPNQTASRQAVRCYAHGEEPFALRTEIGVSYKNTPDHVKTTLTRVLSAVEGILNQPAPQVLVSRFDDFAVIYEMRWFPADYSKKSIINSEINRRAWYAFKREGIEIPFPIRDVYIKKPVETAITEDTLRRTLKDNELLAAIDEEQWDRLLEGVEIKRYGEGEMVIAEGSDGRYFHHILSGRVDVLKNNRVINTLGANDYFGEFSLFTGDKTTANVRAAEECEILTIASDRFRETVKLNKDMALKLSEVIARRRAALKELDVREAGKDPMTITNDSQNIFLRIRKYFSV